MADCSANGQGKLPSAAYDLAIRLGASSNGRHPIVTLTQKGRMKRKLGSASWMTFNAVQTIATATCNFEWRARFGPLGMISICDALQDGVGRLDVTALGVVPIACTAHTAALTRGELMRYLAELAWAPNVILANAALRWREEGPDMLVVSTGDGVTAVEVKLGLDRDGRIATAFAADRPHRRSSRSVQRRGEARFPTIGVISDGGCRSLGKSPGKLAARPRLIGRAKSRAGRRAPLVKRASSCRLANGSFEIDQAAWNDRLWSELDHRDQWPSVHEPFLCWTTFIPCSPARKAWKSPPH